MTKNSHSHDKLSKCKNFMPKITEEKGKPERTVTGKNAYPLLRCSAPFLFHWSALTPMEIHQWQEGV